VQTAASAAMQRTVVIAAVVVVVGLVGVLVVVVVAVVVERGVGTEDWCFERLASSREVASFEVSLSEKKCLDSIDHSIEQTISAKKDW
jgi:beta-lactamase regulating signal transducer with metallopeptidase domain